MVREELVRRKLAHLTGYLEELAAHAAIPLDAYVRAGGPGGRSSGSSNSSSRRR